MSLWRNVSTSSPICSPFHISLTNKPSRTWVHKHGDTERTNAESSCKIQLHVTCTAVRKEEKRKRERYQKRASAGRTHSQLFSVILTCRPCSLRMNSHWGEANKDRQDCRGKLLQGTPPHTPLTGEAMNSLLPALP